VAAPVARALPAPVIVKYQGGLVMAVWAGVFGRPMTPEPVMSVGRQPVRIWSAPGVVGDQEGRVIIVSGAVRSGALA
jgi:hypothetical protein